MKLSKYIITFNKHFRSSEPERGWEGLFESSYISIKYQVASARIFSLELALCKGLITWAGLVWVCRDLGMFVKRNKNQLLDYMTTRPAHTEAARLIMP